MKGRAWAEINLENLAHNVECIRKRIGPGVKLMPAVKADAYGHGMLNVTRKLLSIGCHAVAVATVDEAVALREGGVRAPILVLGGVLPEEVPVLVDVGASVNISDLQLAGEFARIARSKGGKIGVHLKIDTGMGRMGVCADKAVEAAVHISATDGLRLEGIFTHFPSAEDDPEFTRRQIEDFGRICDRISALGIDVPLRHAANSAAIFMHSASAFNTVRPGLSLYGYIGAPGTKDCGLRPVMSVKSRIVLLKGYQPGWTIGYGRTYRVERPMLAAVVPIGYADGYSRLLSNRGAMLAGGRKVPVVGRVSMDQTVVDVTDVPGVRLGDEVVVYGSQGGEHISVADVAETLGTVINEVLCMVGKRLPRIYINEECGTAPAPGAGSGNEVR